MLAHTRVCVCVWCITIITMLLYDKPRRILRLHFYVASHESEKRESFLNEWKVTFWNFQKRENENSEREQRINFSESVKRQSTEFPLNVIRSSNICLYTLIQSITDHNLSNLHCKIASKK